MTFQGISLVRKQVFLRIEVVSYEIMISIVEDKDRRQIRGHNRTMACLVLYEFLHRINDDEGWLELQNPQPQAEKENMNIDMVQMQKYTKLEFDGERNSEIL